MPNGGYPIWMQVNLIDTCALRLKVREVWVVQRVVSEVGVRWENAHQVPPKAIAALVYHLAYWGMSKGTDAVRGAMFDDARLAPWSDTNGWCLYDY